MQQQELTHQYMRMMQHQKHEQARYYTKSAKDLPSLKTGDPVYIQLVPNVRRSIPATVIETLSVKSYKVQYIKGGIYVRNRKFIKVRHTDLRQSLKTTPKDTIQGADTRYTGRPRRTTRRPQTHRVNEVHMDKIYMEKIYTTCKRLYF